MSGWAGSVRRGLIWGVLLAALGIVGVAALRGWRGRPEPPPILGELPAFALVDHQGRAVGREELAGTPWIADLVFTRCALACPRMTAAMARLDRRLPREGVRLVSVSIDPAHDTPEVLAAYAARHGASARWRFLTGDPAAVRALARDGFKLGVAAVAGGPTPDSRSPTATASSSSTPPPASAATTIRSIPSRSPASNATSRRSATSRRRDRSHGGSILAGRFVALSENSCA
jgi:protein SCO1/2